MDLSHLNALAVEHYFETDVSKKETLRQCLWESTHELLKHLNIECALMDRDDMVQELTLRLVKNPETGSKEGWIDRFNPTKDKGAGYVGYIAANAKLAARNLFRDAKDGGFSRRTLEAKSQVLSLVTKDKMSLQAAKAQVVINHGMGMDLLASLDAALQVGDVTRSLDAPLDETGNFTLEDVTPAVHRDPMSPIDRTEIKVTVDTLPLRYSKVLQGIVEGKDPFVEINFEEPLQLAEKAVLVDTAMKMLRSKFSPDRLNIA